MDSNPFAAPPHQMDPFADPSVHQALAENSTHQQQNVLNNFNPFSEHEGGSSASQARTQSVSQPESSQPSVDPPPAYTPPGSHSVDNSVLLKRQTELELKAAELQRREEQLRSMHGGVRQNNWPPLPTFIPVGPCFYQDFSVDIPLDFQRTVKFIYYLWGFHILILFLNILASLAWFCVDRNGGTTFGLSILWFTLFTPCSFVCWYRPVYKAFRSDSSFNFFLFFFVFFFQFCFYIIHSLGITNFSVGLISGLGVVGTNLGVGLLMIFVGIFFALLAVISFIALVKVHRIYRSTGASFQKAQQEFAIGVVRNEVVQTTAAEAAANAARDAVQGQYGTGSRY